MTLNLLLLKDNLPSIDSSQEPTTNLILHLFSSVVITTTTVPASGLILRQLKLGFIQVWILYLIFPFKKKKKIDITYGLYLVSVNVPLRDYQFAITKTALFSNTLVALPTGLGKTLIAAVVMYNYFRWFPQGKIKPIFVSLLEAVLIVSLPGKIVFAAPSRPLVMQQIEACHNIVGIPQVCHLFSSTSNDTEDLFYFIWV